MENTILQDLAPCTLLSPKGVNSFEIVGHCEKQFTMTPYLPLIYQNRVVEFGTQVEI